MNRNLTTLKRIFIHKEVLEWRIAASSNGYIFPVRRPKTKNGSGPHQLAQRGAREGHQRLLSQTTRSRHILSGIRMALGMPKPGTELPVLAELMGHAEIQTTMIYVHASQEDED